MANDRTPSGVRVSRMILSQEDPLLAEIATGGYIRDDSLIRAPEGDLCPTMTGNDHTSTIWSKTLSHHGAGSSAARHAAGFPPVR
jgi:hypothetical protein